MIPRQIVPVRRPVGGDSVAGKWVEGTTSPLPDIKTTVQVARGNDLNVLPEGRRTGQEWVIYPQEFLNSELEGDEEPDEVFIEGAWCIIIHRGSWQNMVRPHYRYIVQRKTVK